MFCNCINTMARPVKQHPLGSRNPGKKKKGTKKKKGKGKPTARSQNFRTARPRAFGRGRSLRRADDIGQIGQLLAALTAFQNFQNQKQGDNRGAGQKPTNYTALGPEDQEGFDANDINKQDDPFGNTQKQRDQTRQDALFRPVPEDTDVPRDELADAKEKEGLEVEFGGRATKYSKQKMSERFVQELKDKSGITQQNLIRQANIRQRQQREREEDDLSGQLAALSLETPNYTLFPSRHKDTALNTYGPGEKSIEGINRQFQVPTGQFRRPDYGPQYQMWRVNQAMAAERQQADRTVKREERKKEKDRKGYRPRAQDMSPVSQKRLAKVLVQGVRDDRAIEAGATFINTPKAESSDINNNPQD